MQHPDTLRLPPLYLAPGTTVTLSKAEKLGRLAPSGHGCQDGEKATLAVGTKTISLGLRFRIESLPLAVMLKGC